MKLRHALSAITGVAIAAAAPAIASAQSASTTSNHVVASTPVPNPPEKTATVTKVRHHAKTTHSHRRHKMALKSAKADAKEDKLEAAKEDKAEAKKPSAVSSAHTVKSTAVNPTSTKK